MFTFSFPIFFSVHDLQLFWEEEAWCCLIISLAHLSCLAIPFFFIAALFLEHALMGFYF